MHCFGWGSSKCRRIFAARVLYGTHTCACSTLVKSPSSHHLISDMNNTCVDSGSLRLFSVSPFPYFFCKSQIQDVLVRVRVMLMAIKLGDRLDATRLCAGAFVRTLFVLNITFGSTCESWYSNSTVHYLHTVCNATTGICTSTVLRVLLSVLCQLSS